jgi:hypothetical protein
VSFGAVGLLITWFLVGQVLMILPVTGLALLALLAVPGRYRPLPST